MSDFGRIQAKIELSNPLDLRYAQNLGYLAYVDQIRVAGQWIWLRGAIVCSAEDDSSIGEVYIKT